MLQEDGEQVFFFTDEVKNYQESNGRAQHSIASDFGSLNQPLRFIHAPAMHRYVRSQLQRSGGISLGNLLDLTLDALDLQI